MPRAEFEGPYLEENGADAFGHLVNGYGRCAGMNEEPPTCPPEEEDPEEE